MENLPFSNPFVSQCVSYTNKIHLNRRLLLALSNVSPVIHRILTEQPFYAMNLNANKTEFEFKIKNESLFLSTDLEQVLSSIRYPFR